MSTCLPTGPSPLPRPCIRRICAGLLPALAGVLLMIFPADAQEKALPFDVGETLRYSVSWEMIPAGKATFRVMEPFKVGNENAWHFALDVKSNRYIDWLYKIRDRYEGFSTPSLDRSLWYKKIQTGKDKRNILVVFDWKTHTAKYSNFNSPRDPLPIPDGTYDPLSAFYRMRCMDFDAAQSLCLPVTDGKKQFTQIGNILGKETITTASGTYDTYIVEPRVDNFSGVFEKSKDANIRLWVTADEKKIPVRIEVKVFIGAVIFELE